MAAKTRAVWKFWLVLLPIACCAPCLAPLADPYRRPERVIDRFPIGSKLSDLDKFLVPFYKESKVNAWTLNGALDTEAEKVRTEFGAYYVRNLGTYDQWTKLRETRDAFTGEIRFTRYSIVIPDDLAPSYVVSLIYVKGVLMKRDYGILPG